MGSQMQWVILFLLILPVQAEVRTAHCQDITAVHGESAAITCFFSEQVSPEEPFAIVKHPLNGSDGQEFVVRFFDGEPKTKPGYSYKNHTGHNQTVEIPVVDKQFEGKYQCQYIYNSPTDDEQRPSSCVLQVQEAGNHTGGETQGGDTHVPAGPSTRPKETETGSTASPAPPPQSGCPSGTMTTGEFANDKDEIWYRWMKSEIRNNQLKEDLLRVQLAIAEEQKSLIYLHKEYLKQNTPRLAADAESNEH
ncbi:hypothetical protein BaRGS_00030742 [Batillaria attramentaria]|uniref:Uncharacterized protein n=1 Tax=Batillaria attramentaria TaxID=370345 RepID=A0ABD0JTL2_9CAEN